MNFRKILFLTGLLTLIPSPETNFDLINFLKKSDKRKPPVVESVDPFFFRKKEKIEYFLPYNLKDINKNNSLEGTLIGVEPGKKVLLEGNDFDFEKENSKTIFGKEKSFEKYLELKNNTKLHDWVKVDKDSFGRAVFNTSYTDIRDGPFVTSSNEGNLFVRSLYGNFDVIPSKIYLEKNGVKEDSLEIINEEFYPPYYISSRLKEKKELTSLDLLEVIGSYHNMEGDYFNSNHKELVCTDVATLLIKSVGLDYEKMIDRNKIPGNDFKQRNIGIFRTVLEKEGYNKYVHYFKEGDKGKILREGVYENLTAENFGIDAIKPGQIMFLTRFYNTGKDKGKVQNWDAHLAAVTEVNNGLITKAAMVSSDSRKPPYDQNIRYRTDVDFKKWYEYRQDYMGSNETNESLRYRLYVLVEMDKILNEMKNNPLN